jgi:hypothetical protein
VKTLHAKIGELTLENDFCSGELSKAGLLNANDDRPEPMSYRWCGRRTSCG